jgi:hypothetical protein
VPETFRLQPLDPLLSQPVEIIANSIDYPLAAAVCQYAQYDESKVAPLQQALRPLHAGAILMRTRRRGLRRHAPGPSELPGHASPARELKVEA